jgi:hypothetical protein
MLLAAIALVKRRTPLDSVTPLEGLLSRAKTFFAVQRAGVI